MDKAKVAKIAGIATVGVLVAGFAVYGLSNQEGSPIYGIFKNDANKLGSASAQKIENTKNSEDENKIDDSKLATDIQAQKDAENSKFPANKILTWQVSDILKEPVNKDYEYKINDDKRIVKNDTGVRKPDDYARQIKAYSKVYANQQFRNPTDDTYESGRNDFSTAINELQKNLSDNDKNGRASAGNEALQKLYIQYFNSDGQYLANLNNMLALSQYNLEVDPDGFRMKMTKSADNGVYAFEGILRDKSSGQQYVYTSGYYNSKSHDFDVRNSIFLMDGAVAKDKWTYNPGSTQQDSNN